jgi:hypothetical protein
MEPERERWARMFRSGWIPAQIGQKVSQLCSLVPGSAGSDPESVAFGGPGRVLRREQTEQNGELVLPDEVLLHYPGETCKGARNLVCRTVAALSGHDQLPSGLTSTFVVEDSSVT